MILDPRLVFNEYLEKLFGEVDGEISIIHKSQSHLQRSAQQRLTVVSFKIRIVPIQCSFRNNRGS